MRIGIAAKRSTLTVDTIRFYERSSLLRRPPRTSGGFRRYSEDDMETLGFIQRVQGLGFSLREIRGLLELRRSHQQPCAQVRSRLERKLGEISVKLGNLRRLQHELQTTLSSCKRQLRGSSPRCPVLRGTAGKRLETAN
jgi:DNA-binding transcriptional MerR regulator